MSVILLCLTLICSVVGYGGVGLRRPENMGYFLRYLDHDLGATWPVLGQNQVGPFPKTYSSVVRIVDGDQNGNLAPWPVLSQYQDNTFSKQYPDVTRNADGDVTSNNQFWQDPQSNSILGYILGGFGRNAPPIDKPEPSSKCTVQNNLKISSSNEPGETTGGKFEKLLKRYSYGILQRTEGLISKSQVEFQDQLVKLFEEMSNRSSATAADHLLRAMEDKFVSVGPQTKLGHEERNVTFSEDYPRPDTEREGGVTGPISNGSGDEVVDVILRQTERLISRSQAELQDQLIERFEEATKRIISTAADNLLSAMEEILINGRPHTKVGHGEQTNVTTPKSPKVDSEKEVVTTPVSNDSGVNKTTAVNNRTTAFNDNRTTTLNNRTTTVNDNRTTSVNDNRATAFNDSRTTTVNDNRTTAVNNNRTTIVNDNRPTAVNDDRPTASNNNRTTIVNDNRTTAVNDNKTTVEAALTTTPGSAVANSSSSTSSWYEHDFAFPGTKLFGAEDGERGGKGGDSGTNFTRTSQQMPKDDIEDIWNPFYLGLNRPSSLGHSPHGLRRRPKSSEYQKPHY